MQWVSVSEEQTKPAQMLIGALLRKEMSTVVTDLYFLSL